MVFPCQSYTHSTRIANPLDEKISSTCPTGQVCCLKGFGKDLFDMQKNLLPLLLALPLLACDPDSTPTLTDSTEDSNDFRSGPTSTLEVVTAFNPQLGETPESVATDFDGNLYVSLALTGELVKIDPNGVRSHLAWLPLGNPADCVGPFPAIMGALAIDPMSKDLYLPVNSCDYSAKGIYRVTQAGTVTMIAEMPPESLGNGIALRLGHVYVSDSGSPRIFRAPTNGTGAPAEVWTTEPLLADDNPFDPIPGANGLQFFNKQMWVTNASAHSLITIDLEFPLDGTGNIQPGEATMVFGPMGSGATWEQDVNVFPGCDDFAFDLIGSIYCTTDPFQTVVYLNTHTGDAEIVWDGADGLDGPSAAAFGRGLLRRTLFISNANFPFFPSTGNGPSILKTVVPIGGYPLR